MEGVLKHLFAYSKQFFLEAAERKAVGLLMSANCSLKSLEVLPISLIGKAMKKMKFSLIGRRRKLVFQKTKAFSLLPWVTKLPMRMFFLALWVRSVLSQN